MTLLFRPQHGIKSLDLGRNEIGHIIFASNVQRRIFVADNWDAIKERYGSPKVVDDYTPATKGANICYDGAGRPALIFLES